MPAERHRVLPRMNFTSPYVDLPKRLTVGENLAVFADLYGVRRPRERIDAVAADCDLGGLLKRPYGSLSAGQRTRVSLAKAVLNEPEVLLLDEPTASLDPDIGDRMRTYLERYQHRTGCTMLLASHHMGEVERMCDDVIMLRAGVVVDQGSPRALIERYGRGDDGGGVSRRRAGARRCSTCRHRRGGEHGMTRNWRTPLPMPPAATPASRASARPRARACCAGTRTSSSSRRRASCR